MIDLMVKPNDLSTKKENKKAKQNNKKQKTLVENAYSPCYYFLPFGDQLAQCF